LCRIIWKALDDLCAFPGNPQSAVAWGPRREATASACRTVTLVYSDIDPGGKPRFDRDNMRGTRRMVGR